MAYDLVSIIMLSRNKARYVEESVRSVMNQSYQNWELLFVDDNSQDDTIRLLMNLRDEDDNKHREIGKVITSRFKVSQNIFEKGSMGSMRSALRDAQGRWIAFLNAGDLWSPNKLERQISFMEDNNYALSYTKYGVIDKHSKSKDAVIGGPEVIDEKLMLKCFWPGMLTVIFDAKRLGKVRIPIYKDSNCYALLMMLCEKTECHLLDENLACNRTKWGLFDGAPFKKKFSWRYEAYRTVEDIGIVHSVWKTIENLWYTLVKRVKYVERVK